VYGDIKLIFQNITQKYVVNRMIFFNLMLFILKKELCANGLRIISLGKYLIFKEISCMVMLFNTIYFHVIRYLT